MGLSGVFGFVLVTTCCMQQVLLYPQKESYVDGNRDLITGRYRQADEIRLVADTLTDDTLRIRRKRSLWQIGKAAIQVVLRGSKTVDKRGALKMFEKSGDYESAVQDFYSVRPTNVKRVRLSNGFVAQIGEVGDRRLFLRDDGIGDTVLEIVPVRKLAAGKGTPVVYRVTYTDDFYTKKSGPRPKLIYE